MPNSPTEIMERIMENEAEIVGMKRDLEHGQKEFSRITAAVEGIRYDLREEFREALEKIEDKFDKFQAWVRTLVLTVSGAVIVFLANQIIEVIKGG